MNNLPATRFPDDFLFGASTSSYQIEGAWNEDGKGPSIWDVRGHRPLANGQPRPNGDVACDHYHRYRGDIALMKEIGLNAYRFSIAWPRIVPTGKGRVEMRGMDFYSRLVDELLAAGIQPVPTLFHWDMPAPLYDQYQGWMSKEVGHHFTDFAELCFRHLGDRVSTWITHNEPRVHVYCGYLGTEPPGYNGGVPAAIKAEHNMLVAHAQAVQAFRQTGIKGQIGITLSVGPAYPLTGSPADAEAARKAVEYDVYWNLDAIYRGRYPALADEPKIAVLFAPDRDEDCAFIHTHPSDFIGINHYRANFAEAKPDHPMGFDLVFDSRVQAEERTGLGWWVMPEGIYEVIGLLAKRYPGIPLYVTENGCAEKVPHDQPPRTDDPERISFLQRYMMNAHRALKEGANLKGYFVWSLLDNFEWGSYEPRFGLIGVDFKTQERTLKSSAWWLKEVIANRGF